MNERFPTWIDGVTHGPGTGRLSVEDSGFLLGLAIFETLLFEGGELHGLDAHLERFQRGIRSVGIEWPLPWDPARALREFARTLSRDVLIRMTATRGVPGRGPSLVLTARSFQRAPEPGITLAIGPRVHKPGGARSHIKSASRLEYVLAREAAQAQGAWDALLLTQEGDLSEGTICNVFLVHGERISTPGLDRGALAGTTRQHLIDCLRAQGIEVLERTVQPEELAAADEVFLTNSSGPIVGVVGILGVRDDLPGMAGPMAQRCRKCLS